MPCQFEAIHPFVEGCLRTGRAPNLLFLVDKRLRDIPVLCPCRRFIRRKALHFRYLLDVTTRQAWEAWMLFVLEAVGTAAEWISAKTHALRDSLVATAAAIRQRLPRTYSRELAALIFVNPCCRIGDVVEADVAGRQTATST